MRKGIRGIIPVSTRREACERARVEPYFAHVSRDGKYFLVDPTELDRAERLSLRRLTHAEVYGDAVRGRGR